MRVQQISVFLENIEGRIAEVTGVLSKANVNIKALSLADTSDFGVLRLIVDNNEKAEEALKAEGFTVGKTNVLAVEVANKPGGLHNILNILSKSGINVEYMYSLVKEGGDNAIMIFRFDNIDGAITALSDNGITVIKGSEVYSL